MIGRFWGSDQDYCPGTGTATNQPYSIVSCPKCGRRIATRPGKHGKLFPHVANLKKALKSKLKDKLS